MNKAAGFIACVFMSAAIADPATYKSDRSGYSTAQVKGFAVTSTVTVQTINTPITVYQTGKGQFYLTEACASRSLEVEVHISDLGGLVALKPGECHTFESPVAVPVGAAITCVASSAAGGSFCSVFGVER
jgi:hypothetical protein